MNKSGLKKIRSMVKNIKKKEVNSQVLPSGLKKLSSNSVHDGDEYTMFKNFVKSKKGVKSYKESVKVASQMGLRLNGRELFYSNGGKKLNYNELKTKLKKHKLPTEIKKRKLPTEVKKHELLTKLKKHKLKTKLKKRK